jgi:hypothetical protein
VRKILDTTEKRRAPPGLRQGPSRLVVGVATRPRGAATGGGRPFDSQRARGADHSTPQARRVALPATRWPLDRSDHYRRPRKDLGCDARSVGGSLSHAHKRSGRSSLYFRLLTSNRVTQTMKTPTTNKTTPGAASVNSLSSPNTLAVQPTDPVTPRRARTRPPTRHASPRSKPDAGPRSSAGGLSCRAIVRSRNGSGFTPPVGEGGQIAPQRSARK